MMLFLRRTLVALLALLALASCGSTAVHSPAATTVIQVRHAEKTLEPMDDPPLTHGETSGLEP